MRTHLAVSAALAVIVCFPTSAVAALVGDFNGDGFVGHGDLDMILAGWWQDPWGEVPPPLQGDLDAVLGDWGLGTPVVLAPTRGLWMNFVLVDNSAVLTGYVTQDLVIQADTDWLGAQLLVTLDEPGRIWQDPLLSQSPQSPNPAFFPSFPALEFDTYVNNGVLGDSVSVTGAVDLGASPDAVFDVDTLSVAWYTTRSDDIGELALARITLAEDATGNWSFLATASPAAGPMVVISGTIDGGAVLFPGDLDGNGFVGSTDLDILLGGWGGTVPPADPRADPSGDGSVGQDDLDFVLGYWGYGLDNPHAEPGAGGYAGQAVPEPTAVALLALGAAALPGRRRRK